MRPNRTSCQAAGSQIPNFNPEQHLSGTRLHLAIAFPFHVTRILQREPFQSRIAGQIGRGMMGRGMGRSDFRALKLARPTKSRVTVTGHSKTSQPGSNETATRRCFVRIRFLDASKSFSITSYLLAQPCQILHLQSSQSCASVHHENRAEGLLQGQRFAHHSTSQRRGRESESTDKPGEFPQSRRNAPVRNKSVLRDTANSAQSRALYASATSPML